MADSKKSAAHPLCNEFSEFPAHNQSTSARPPFPPTFRLIYRRRHHRLHHHLLRYIADVVRQASARIASCSPREFKSGQCAVNAASFTTVGLLRSSADVTPPVAARVLEPEFDPLLLYKCRVRTPPRFTSRIIYTIGRDGEGEGGGRGKGGGEGHQRN